MFDVRGIARTQDKRMHISVVIAAISTEMLLLARAFGSDCHHDFAHHRFIGRIRRRDLDRDWCATLINPQVDCRARPGTVCLVLASGLATELSRARATINRLPLPLDAARPIVKAQQHFDHLGEASFLLPGLEVVVDAAAGDAEPAAMHGFPLAAGPQDIPDTVDNRASIGWRTSRPTMCWWFGQQALDFAPQWARNTKVIDVRWFCARILHGVAFLTMRINTTIVSRLRHLVQSFRIYG